MQRDLLTRLLTGKDPVALGPALLGFARERRDISNEMERVEAARSTSFNLGALPSQQAMPLVRYQSGDAVRIADLLGMDNVTFPGET